tara:strand:+ start:176 stop:334 length:159 start_codon:yes stop_codon:yes gene_type:complete
MDKKLHPELKEKINISKIPIVRISLEDLIENVRASTPEEKSKIEKSLSKTIK